MNELNSIIIDLSKDKKINCMDLNKNITVDSYNYNNIKKWRIEKLKKNLKMPLDSTGKNSKAFSQEFSILGEFFHKDNKNFYEIYYKINKEKVVEYFIYDIIRVKEATHKKAEASFKNIFLAKIAHEFKTPIISILGIIKIIKDEIKDLLIVKDDIKKVKCLSKYMIFLITDIIN